jgi:hypothetical protein
LWAAARGSRPEKNHPRGSGSKATTDLVGNDDGWCEHSGTKTGGLDQAYLITAGGEFPALITLHNDTATGFDPDHTGSNPAKGCGLEHLDHISGLKIQLHVREGKTAGQTRKELINLSLMVSRSDCQS